MTRLTARGAFLRSHAARALAATLIAAALCATARASEPSPAQREPGVATELVLRALTLLGVNYKFGGNSPDVGLDCSGLVRHVFSEAIGVVLPRRSEEISRNGAPVDQTELKPGDLVFFNTLRRAFSHVGIYIGNGQFVHAPSSGGSVRVESMAGSYWTQRFDGARRLLDADGGQLASAGLDDEVVKAASAIAAAGAVVARPAARTAPLMTAARAASASSRASTASSRAAQTPSRSVAASPQPATTMMVNDVSPARKSVSARSRPAKESVVQRVIRRHR